MTTSEPIRPDDPVTSSLGIGMISESFSVNKIKWRMNFQMMIIFIGAKIEPMAGEGPIAT